MVVLIRVFKTCDDMVEDLWIFNFIGIKIRELPK